MKDKSMKIYLAIQLLLEEKGQDLVEYALVIALVALAATAGMNVLASDINNAFSTVGSMVAGYAT